MQHGSFFDPIPVTLSFLVAIVASFTALELARRVASTEGTTAKIWLLTGSISMGIGIWTMHFVGMLAFKMGMPYSYDVPLTTFSLLIGVAASAFAIYVASRASVSKLNIFYSGLILGAGIAGMHYSGMAAMKMQATIVYDPLIVFASIVIAVVSASAAIYIAFTVAHSREHNLFKYKLVAAVVMGAGICGMHYTGMLAASYIPFEGAVMNHVEDAGLQGNLMAVILAVSALFILGITHLTIFFDYRISQQKQIGERAEQETIRLNKILDESHSEIYVFEADTLKFLSVNKGATDNLGYTRDQLLTMSPVDIKPSYSENEFRKLLVALQYGEKKSMDFDTTHQRKDGTTYPVHVSLQFSTASDAPVFVAVTADVTERINLENQIAQSKKLESIGQLAAGIAHEINTPAQFVGDNTRFLQSAFQDLQKLTDTYQTFVTAVKNNAVDDNEMKSIELAVIAADPDYLKDEIPIAIEQTLDGISRISKIVLAMKEFSHPGNTNKELVDLNKNISNTIVVASNEWKYLAEMNIDFDENLPRVRCYPQQISQVVLNLIVNAAHSIADKLDGNVQTLGSISVSTREKNGCAEVRITDTGCGIPENIRGRVFDPFFTTKEVGVGTGQGLSMAYSTIVDRHKGQISIESEVGEGTTFVIVLPIDQSSTSEKAVAA